MDKALALWMESISKEMSLETYNFKTQSMCFSPSACFIDKLSNTVDEIECIYWQAWMPKNLVKVALFEKQLPSIVVFIGVSCPLLPECWWAGTFFPLFWDAPLNAFWTITYHAGTLKEPFVLLRWLPAGFIDLDLHGWAEGTLIFLFFPPH